jgi:hypothetical protein
MYEVSQKFETLGDPCRTQHKTREQAEQAAQELRASIAENVAATPLEDEDGDGTGCAFEVEAWRRAWDIATNDGTEEAETYGAKAGAYIADHAVEIEGRGQP